MPYAGYSPDVVRLLEQQGQNAANLRLQQGQTLGTIISGIGQIASRVPEQIVAAKAKAKAEEGLKLAHSLAVKYRQPDGSTDFLKVANDLDQANYPEIAAPIRDRAQKEMTFKSGLAKDAATIANTTSEAAARQASESRAQSKFTQEQSDQAKASANVLAVKTILSGQADPATGKITDWPKAIDAVRQGGFRAEADQLTKSWQEEQKAAQGLSTGAAALKTQAVKDAASQLSRYTTTANYTALRAKLAPEVAALFPETPPKRSDILKIGLSPKEVLDANMEERKFQQKATEDAMAQSGTPDLSPAGLDLVAHQFAMTGQLPPMGMGGKAAKVRTDIINKAADMYAGLDLPSQVAAFKANQAALSKLVQNRSAVGAFEETALKNLDVFLNSAKKIADTGSPYLNTPIRAISEKVLGSPDMAAFQTARRTVIPEFAKILSNPTLTGQLSDSARKEVEEVVSGNATLKQIIAAVNVLHTDADNRRTSLDDQITAIQKIIATPPGSTIKTPTGLPAGAIIYGPDGKPIK